MLAGKPFTEQKWNFCSVKAHSLSALIERAGNVRDQARIHPQMNPMLIRGDAGQIFKLFQTSNQLCLLSDRIFIALPNSFRRIPD